MRKGAELGMDEYKELLSKKIIMSPLQITQSEKQLRFSPFLGPAMNHNGVQGNKIRF